jgi:hypothetical protein
MKTRRLMFAPGVLSLGAAIVAGAVLGPPASAQTAATTTTSAKTTTTATSAVVSVNGIVSGMPESVSFSGQAQLKANVVTDPDFGSPPTLLLSIDFSKVTGVGSLTGKKYVTSNQEVLTRRMSASDTVQATFPFYLSGDSSMASSRVAAASFNLSFNVDTLKLTGASGEIVSP